jgi:uncharacterized protein (DUF1697 family)
VTAGATAAPRRVALLRGINVGGKTSLPMAELRDVFAMLGCADVQTYVQSGNVVFRGGGEAIAERLEEALQARFGFRPRVMVRTAGEWRAAMSGNPFTEREPAKVALCLLEREPAPEALARLRSMEIQPEEMRAGGAVVYVYYANGMGRAKLSFARIESTLRVAATARNWNTVRKIGSMLDET